MLLKLYQTGQPILRKKAKSVSKDALKSRHTQDVIDFMIATLKDAPGVGLAAPQVGEDLRIIIINDQAKYHDQVPKEVLKEQGRKPIALKVLINPELEIIKDKQDLWFEGCLSVDGYLGTVPRYTVVRVKALDRNGKAVSYRAQDWHARILQHELDHLNGILYIDKMRPKSFMSIKNFNMFWRKTTKAKIEKTYSLKLS
jgi:peptide deformylase